jgi:hypothetical protein
MNFHYSLTLYAAQRWNRTIRPDLLKGEITLAEMEASALTPCLSLTPNVRPL